MVTKNVSNELQKEWIHNKRVTIELDRKQVVNGINDNHFSVTKFRTIFKKCKSTLVLNKKL